MFSGLFEVPLEEQLDADQLESLKKYQERKQQKQTHVYAYGQVRTEIRRSSRFSDMLIQSGASPPTLVLLVWAVLTVSHATGVRSSHSRDL